MNLGKQMRSLLEKRTANLYSCEKENEKLKARIYDLEYALYKVSIIGHATEAYMTNNDFYNAVNNGLDLTQ